jgi:hypothetical protein
MNCIQCHKPFKSKRTDAKFDTDACRKKYVRDNIKADIKDIKLDKVSEINKESVRDKKLCAVHNKQMYQKDGQWQCDAGTDPNYNPDIKERPKTKNNWENKFESKEHAIEGMLKSLEINRNSILKHGVSETATFSLGEKVFTLTKKGLR